MFFKIESTYSKAGVLRVINKGELSIAFIKGKRDKIVEDLQNPIYILINLVNTNFLATKSARTCKKVGKCMEIKRDKYLNELITKENNGLIKVITGLRRCGKSYLLNTLFKNYYLFLDEIQLLDNFVMTLNGFLSLSKFDVYVTGSNSKMLSKDVITEFRDRGDQIHLYPLSFKEFFESTDKEFEEAYLEYQYFGGMPQVLKINNDNNKQQFLKDLYKETYLKDIVERNGIKNVYCFEKLMNILASSIGSFTNPTNIEKAFKSVENIAYSHDTIKKHIEHIKDSFLVSEAVRYDIKGKKYIGSNSKYYFTDIGLRNALINFKQSEPSHIMENIIYNELIIKGYSVDVGITKINEQNENGNYVTKQLETDFVCNKINERIYIQAVCSMEILDKLIQEKKPLINIDDNFKKIIIVKDSIKKYFTDEGIEVISLKDWLLDN